MAALALNFNLAGDCISITNALAEKIDYEYTITPLNSGSTKSVMSGSMNGDINISSLSEGLYILIVKNSQTTEVSTFKFRK